MTQWRVGLGFVGRRRFWPTRRLSPFCLQNVSKIVQSKEWLLLPWFSEDFYFSLSVSQLQFCRLFIPFVHGRHMFITHLKKKKYGGFCFYGIGSFLGEWDAPRSALYILTSQIWPFLAGIDSQRYDESTLSARLCCVLVL